MAFLAINDGHMITIPFYHIQEVVYQSKRSLIYKAFDEIDSLPVYIKLLNSEYPSNAQIAQFNHEYEMTKKLHDLLPDMVIHVKKMIKVQNTYALILEDFGGTSLSQNLKNNHLTIEKFLEFAIQITKILGHLHNQNLLHKDLNPSNILWNPQTNQIKIIDFGIATWLLFENIEDHNVRNLEGTLAYLSPEQTGRMNRVVDYRSDYYSLGVTFYEMLTHHVPFPSQDPMEIVHAHMAKIPKPPHEIDKNIPREISKIILKLMSKTPEERYQSTHGLVEDLYQCQLDWSKNKQIFPFTLGTKDISTNLQLSKKLYGRDKELYILMKSFERSLSRTPEFTIVAGDSGVGKSALIHEMQKAVAIKNGNFVSGKCDQYKRNIPYEALVKALKSLVQQILTEDPEEILKWKKAIAEAVGQHGSIIIGVIPELKQIIGIQPPIPDLTSTESENRFNYTFQNFIKSLCDHTHPLTIFLDDLQWVDPSTLNLLTLILSDPATKNLYLLGAYRKNEVSESHILMIALENLKKEGAIFNLIDLDPLQIEDIEHMLSDLLKEEKEVVRPLAETCFVKTQGNPFFLNQLLSSLNQEKLLYFDQISGKWSWDLIKIQMQEISQNVVEFMTKKILSLPLPTRKLLEIAACIGNKFELKILSLMNHKPSHQTSSELWMALYEGLVIPEKVNYKFINSYTDFSTSYRFLHDRVQQAVYSIISNTQKKDYHHQIGQILLNEASEDSIEEKIFDIVNQLNLAIDLITSEDEKQKLISLNLQAGKKAKSYSAFTSAAEYLQISRNLLTQDSWQTHYALTLEISKELSECLYILGEENLAEESIKEILNHVKTPTEKALLLSLRTVLYTTHGKYKEAIETSLQGLHLLGIPITKNPSQWELTKEFFLSKWYLGGREISSLIHMPFFTDEKLKMTMSLLQECAAPAFVSGMKSLMGLLMLKQINITLKEGNNIWAPTAYITHAISLNIAGEFKAAFEFGKLSLAMMEKGVEFQQYKARNLVAYAIMVHGWNAHFKTLRLYFKQASEAALQSGDFMNALFGYCHGLDFDPDLTVETVINEGTKYLNLLKTRNQNQWNSTKIRFNFYANLRGGTTDLFSLSEPDFDEYESLERMEQRRFAGGIATYHYSKAIVYFMYEDYRAAFESTKKTDESMDSLIASLYYLEYHFYLFPIYAAIYPQLVGKEKIEAWRRMKAELKKMKKWAKHCPVNFLHHQLLMEAEFARLKGQTSKAQQLYDQAIAKAKESDYVRYEALSNELAAKFYLKLGKDKIAKVYFQEAHYHYQKWGAIAKALHLEKTYPTFFQQRYFSVIDKTQEQTETSTYHSLDFFSVIKASQAITREIHLPKLIVKMMQVVTENAGAQKGLLLLNRKGQYVVEALIDVDRVEISTSFSKQDFPNSILEAVIRTKEPVVIEDATQQREFKKDPYIIYFQPKSVLCFPLINLGEIKGVLYLENNLATNVFKEEHLDIINILSTQIAISIDNAEFYKQLEEKVSKRTHELKEAQDLLIQKEKMAYLGLLMTGIAHEIENPLNFVINFSNLSSDSITDLQNFVKQHSDIPLGELKEIPEALASLKESADAIYQQGKKADHIVKRMIEHSTTSNQNFVYTDLNNIIEQAINLSFYRMRLRFPDFRVRVEKEFSPYLQYVQIIEEDIQRVLINLLDNAYQALYQKSKEHHPSFEPVISIQTFAHEFDFEIRIKDNGMGIDPVHFTRIFSPFFTAHFNQGVGLGLSLCRNIIEKEHQGSLTFSSEKNHFTEFVIKIPLEPQNQKPVF